MNGHGGKSRLTGCSLLAGDFSLGEGNVLQGQSPSTFWPTIAHIAPEALRGNRESPAATTTAKDIYAFGNLMYEVYTGGDPNSDALPPTAKITYLLIECLRYICHVTPQKLCRLCGKCFGQDKGSSPYLHIVDCCLLVLPLMP